MINDVVVMINDVNDFAVINTILNFIEKNPYVASYTSFGVGAIMVYAAFYRGWVSIPTTQKTIASNQAQNDKLSHLIKAQREFIKDMRQKHADQIARMDDRLSRENKECRDKIRALEESLNEYRKSTFKELQEYQNLARQRLKKES